MILQEDITLPSTGIKIQAYNTRAFLSNEDLGTGILCVAESNLVWKKDDNKGLCFEYPHIALHAVSKDLNAFPHECLYVMLDRNIMRNEEDEEDENDSSDNITEIRFVPEDKTLLNPLFTAMNECQALYPDEEMSGDEQGEADEEEEGEQDDDISENQENEGEFQDDEESDAIEQVNGNGTTCVNPNEVELSARGQQILRRLNFNYQMQEQLENEQDTNENSEQYEDA